ncbi:hypothetical protein V6N11_005042 [Hibiscus sabdariffa]|uniref:Uncharacterized protein n=1 Tax=Hibiscus sabdariffa TaxID=183260 RepID=A0ABR2N618_9ROSI
MLQIQKNRKSCKAASLHFMSIIVDLNNLPYNSRDMTKQCLRDKPQTPLWAMGADCEFHTFFAILCYSQRGEAGLPKTWCGATSVIRPLFDGIEVKFDGGILAGIREEKRSR